MTLGPAELMLLMLTGLLLPAMAALAYGIFSGAFERDERVKYVLLADMKPPEPEQPVEPATLETAGRRGS